MLTAVRIPGDVDELKKSFVLANRDSLALVVGARAPRNMTAGDLLLHQEMKANLPRWKALGPFRLVSVGEQVVGGDYTGRDSSRSVTIAARVDAEGNYDARVERLLDILNSQGRRSKDSASQRIVAIQLEPVRQSATPTPDGDTMVSTLAPETGPSRAPLPLAADERGIIVPLRNVENLPQLLARGDHVSFVVNWYDDTIEKLGDAESGS